MQARWKETLPVFLAFGLSSIDRWFVSGGRCWPRIRAANTDHPTSTSDLLTTDRAYVDRNGLHQLQPALVWLSNITSVGPVVKDGT